MNEKRISIVSFYDSDGIVDDYFIYFLQSLSKVTDRIIVAINGKLTDESRIKLKTVTKELYIRKNTGFDFGAYRDSIINYLQSDELDTCYELILCNDTCYGPFISFEKIFSRMNKEDLDFWSINYIDNPLLPHFQSYFMVFRKNAVKFIQSFLIREVDSETADMFQAHGYEHKLSEMIIESHLQTDYYTSNSREDHDIDILKSPDYAIRLLGFPMLKKKVFLEDICEKENCLEALRLIGEKVYPVDYILENAKRLYGTNFPSEVKNRYLSNKYIFEKNYVSREKVIEFCKKYNKIYVYGNGYMSVLFMARFRQYMKEFGGYIVSDEHYQGDLCRGEHVYRFSCIDENVPFVVALMKESSIQVIKRIGKRKNVLFLSII